VKAMQAMKATKAMKAKKAMEPKKAMKAKKRMFAVWTKKLACRHEGDFLSWRFGNTNKGG
jgi:Ni,Fe-hydrogenase I small subunit